MPNTEAIAYAQPVRIVPGHSQGYFAVAQKSDLLTGLGANATVLTVRSTSALPLAIAKVSVGFVTTTAFGTAQTVDFWLYVARGFTAADSAGALLTLNTNDQKLNTYSAAINSTTIRLAQTAEITAGTRTLDANPVGIVGGWSGAAGTTIPMTTIFDATSGKLPIVIGNQEGIVIRSSTAFGASGVGYFYFSMEFEQ